MPINKRVLKKGHRARRFTEQQIAEAVEKAGGILTSAARKLGCAPGTIYDYLKRFPALGDVVTDAREGTLDLAESKLIEQIKKDNLTAIIFFLKTQGRSRGYSDRPEDAHFPGAGADQIGRSFGRSQAFGPVGRWHETREYPVRLDQLIALATAHRAGQLLDVIGRYAILLVSEFVVNL